MDAAGLVRQTIISSSTSLGTIVAIPEQGDHLGFSYQSLHSAGLIPAGSGERLRGQAADEAREARVDALIEVIDPHGDNVTVGDGRALQTSMVSGSASSLLHFHNKWSGYDRICVRAVTARAWEEKA